MNPVDRGCEYDPKSAIRLPMGATAIKKYDIIKITAGLAVPAADNDKQGEFFVALENAATTDTDVLAVPLRHAVLTIAFSGSAPTVGAAYGISDTRTLDQADTTNKLLTVLEVDSTRTTAKVMEYRLSS
jgi:hypothetical protein